ncbi:MAG TPA: carbohydrate kinase family protein, partial [Spirochaetota bacterium]
LIILSRQIMTPDVYFYGMTVMSTIHKLVSAYPEADSYGEIEKTFLCPGGETMNAAILLSKLGLATKIGGPHWGRDTRDVLGSYADRYSIDATGIVYDDTFPGVKDLILVDDKHRTVFGYFAKYFSETVKRWNEPERGAIAKAALVAIDPFFGDSSLHAAEYCVEYGKPYVTIDCRHDSYLNTHCGANVVSREYRSQEYINISDEEAFRLFQESTEGLVIFTSGKNEILFARKGGAVQRFSPYLVEVKSTLGAGDTFRAGVVYGLSQKWDDARVVQFASALAAVVCTRLPIADNPPTLDEVIAFISQR